VEFRAYRPVETAGEFLVFREGLLDVIAVLQAGHAIHCKLAAVGGEESCALTQQGIHDQEKREDGDGGTSSEEGLDHLLPVHAQPHEARWLDEIGGGGFGAHAMNGSCLSE